MFAAHLAAASASRLTAFVWPTHLRAHLAAALAAVEPLLWPETYREDLRHFIRVGAWESDGQ